MKIDTPIIITTNRDFTVAKDSPVHGKGLFAKKSIPRGTRIIEYAGKRVLKKDLITDLVKGLSSLVYIMNINEATVVDAERNGNDARFINHSCSPNCIVYFFDEVPYIYSLREIKTGEELSFDYHLYIESKDKELTEQQEKEFFPCYCGAAICRGTLLAN